MAANITITKPQGPSEPWEVDCDGVKFSVELRPIEKDDPRLREHPDDTWWSRVTRPDGTSEARYGINREVAFTKAASEMRSTRKLVGVDWASVMRALRDEGAFP